MKERNRSKKVHRRAERAPKSLPSSVLFGLLLFLGSSALFLWIGAMVLFRIPDPLGSLWLVAGIGVYLSSFISGFGAAKRYGSAPLPIGLLTGLGQCLLTILAALFLSPGQSGLTSGRSWLLRLALLLCSTLGAILAGHLRFPSKRRRTQ
ncbi:MAG: TIGR04086 family membrane protein [Clostridia bacterium]|nr:TIGR04086 family membrane protein [Clostridia bacterium]